MSTLSTEDIARLKRDKTRQSAHDVSLDDDLNPVVEVIDKSWQRLLTQSEWTSQRRQLQSLASNGGPVLRRGVRVLRGRG